MINGMIIDSDGSKRWYHNDNLHRIDGPAIEYKNGRKEWFLYGVLYDEYKYKTITSNIPLMHWYIFKWGKTTLMFQMSMSKMFPIK
jgi:hypothetical protein